MQMRSLLIFSIIIATLVAAYFLNKWLQQTIAPRQSFQRLFLYILSALLMMFLLSFIMVFIIGRIYPAELIK